MFKLVISDDEGKTTVVPLVRDEITIGRQEGNTIRLTERNVSRQHARLLKSNGSIAVEDLQSSNGIKVNGRRIDASTGLSAGDQITIGDYLLALHMDAAMPVANQPTAAVASPPGHDARTAMIQAPAEPRPPARLVMLSPPAPGAEFALSKELLRIGRAEDLDAWINHRSISREHAEIVRQGAEFRIRDLGSANGVRVNGKDVQRATLRRGDVIELGQVRFRYVSEGEDYVLDTDRTIRGDALDGSASVSRAPIVAALGIILMAVVVAAAFAVGAPSDSTPAATDGNELAADGPQGPDAFTVALEGCERHLEAGEFDAALSYAEKALTINQESLSARRCRARTELAKTDRELFDRGVSRIEEGDASGALEVFGSLSETSRYRARPEIREAYRLWAAQQLAYAREVLSSDPGAARDAARRVLEADVVDRDSRRAAEFVLQRLEASQVRSPEPPAPRRTPRRPNPRSGTRAVNSPSPSPPSPAAPAPAPRASTPIDACREAHGYGTALSRCIVQTVRPTGAPELEHLIQAHRDLGNQGAAVTFMRTYIDRFPTRSMAAQYRQYLNFQRQ